MLLRSSRSNFYGRLIFVLNDASGNETHIYVPVTDAAFVEGCVFINSRKYEAFQL